MTSLKSFNLYLYEKIIIGYCTLTILIILLTGSPLSQYYDEIIFYLSFIVLTFLAAYYLVESKNSFFQFLRLFYPALMFGAFYRETGGLMHLLFDRYFDWQLTAFEHSIFGVNPTLYIDQHLLNVWVNEIISMCYFFYYLMIPGFMIFAYFKKDYRVIKSFLAAACLAFFASYWLFFLYPVEGPRWFFQDAYINNIDGSFFRQAVEFIIANGAVRGGCMPSSHFGVALVILMYTFKYYRKQAYYLLPIVIGLGVGTVWGRFHYISDVIVGGAIGFAAVLLVWKLDNRRSTALYNDSMKMEKNK